MKLSVVIVNYNVRHFLEQCLTSVRRAGKGIEVEVFVVDNASTDGSAEVIAQNFKEVKWIGNRENVGFSKANNQAIAQSKGEYVLLLNPDTVVAEDTFEKCLHFMDEHREAGALGVRMIDGKGRFLPESKRGLPTPSVAFYKTFGLAALFPRSKTFGRYHLGFLEENKTHEVDVLSGAFMLLRRSALDSAGLLDETFFMYGEDIDLSYRIAQAGFKNFYYPETTIIHYKGESTKKGSLNYVRVFYQAMIIFSRKHFGANRSGWFSLFINMAIVFRGALSLLSSLFASSYLFLIDALLSFGGIYFIKNYWESAIKYSEHYYPNQFLFIVVPLYILIWIMAAYLSGGYDKPFRVSKILRGIGVGTVAIAVLYAFLPDEWRFSRAMILLGAVWTGVEMLFTRTLYHLIRYQSVSIEKDTENRSLIVGKADEAARAEKSLRSLGYGGEIYSISRMNDSAKAALVYEADELIFCAADFSYQEIIGQIQQSGDSIDYKIWNANSDALIGSNSKDTAGDLYVAEKRYALFQPAQQRSKRIFDFGFSLLLILLLPVNLFIIPHYANHLRHLFRVLWGGKSWVGFASRQNLAKFKHALPGVLHPHDRIHSFALTDEEIIQVELNYARHYSVVQDIALIWSNYHLLGR